MATTPLRSFARSFGAADTSAPAADRTPADVWMNVGYEVAGEDEDGNATVTFIGTPLGIAIDTQKPIDTSKTRSAKLLNTQTKQNNFLKLLQDEAAKLSPDESVTLNLTVQMRRVKGPMEAPTVEAVADDFKLEIIR